MDIESTTDDKQAIRCMKNLILKEQFELIKIAKTQNPTGRIPHVFIASMLRNYKDVAPWLTYDKIMGYYRTRIKNEATKGTETTENKLHPPKAAKDEIKDDSAEIKDASEPNMLGANQKVLLM